MQYSSGRVVWCLEHCPSGFLLSFRSHLGFGCCVYYSFLLESAAKACERLCRNTVAVCRQTCCCSTTQEPGMQADSPVKQWQDKPYSLVKAGNAWCACSAPAALRFLGQDMELRCWLPAAGCLGALLVWMLPVVTLSLGAEREQWHHRGRGGTSQCHNHFAPSSSARASSSPGAEVISQSLRHAGRKQSSLVLRRLPWIS